MDSQEKDPAGSKPSSPETPRWVKAFGLVALVLVGLFAAVHLAGFGLGGHLHHGQEPQGQPQ
jgi:hypothetical protein